LKVEQFDELVAALRRVLFTASKLSSANCGWIKAMRVLKMPTLMLIWLNPKGHNVITHLTPWKNFTLNSSVACDSDSTIH
jgi:hypothetical protein